MGIDPLSEFVSASRKEKGERTELKMQKIQGDAGFCIKAKGGQKAIRKLAEIMSGVDLSESLQEAGLL